MVTVSIGGPRLAALVELNKKLEAAIVNLAAEGKKDESEKAAKTLALLKQPDVLNIVSMIMQVECTDAEYAILLTNCWNAVASLVK